MADRNNVEFNNFLDHYEITDPTILKDLFESKILTDILELRNPNAEPISFTATVDLVNSYIDRYNRLHKASCRTVFLRLSDTSILFQTCCFIHRLCVRHSYYHRSPPLSYSCTG